MNCREFIERIDDYLDQSSPQVVRADCDEHLADCPYCTDYVSSYREAVRLLREALAAKPDADVPEGLRDQVLRVLDEAPGER